MKRLVSIFAAALISTTILGGCASKTASKNEEKVETRPSYELNKAKSYAEVDQTNPDEIAKSFTIASNTHTPKTAPSDLERFASYYHIFIRQDMLENKDKLVKYVVDGDEYTQGRDVKILSKVNKTLQFEGPHDSYKYEMQVTVDQKIKGVVKTETYKTELEVANYDGKWIVTSKRDIKE